MPFETGLHVKTFFAPDDDTQTEFLSFIRDTKEHLRIAIYGLHLPPLVDELIALHQKGVDVSLVCDHSQAEGKYEHPEILQMIQAGIPLVLGTSQKHQIMHHKFAVRDKKSVLSGSWNFSLGASKQNNYFDIIDSMDRASLFLAKWQQMYDWISQNEQKYQETV